MTSAADRLVADGILKLLLNLQVTAGVANLFITDDLATVRVISDKITAIYKARSSATASNPTC